MKSISPSPSTLGIRPLLRRDSSTSYITRKIYSRVLSSDKFGEISQSATIFYNSLKQKSFVPTGTLESLGEAHFLVWMAYSLYDQILDENQAIQLLSVANILHRLSFRLYLRIGSEERVLSFFDSVDIGNSEEIHTSRGLIRDGIIEIKQIPTQSAILQQLQMKCSGHFINIAALLDLLSITNEQRLSVTTALQEYSVARQLSDDLLDWEDDLKSGKITFVTRRLIKQLQENDHPLHIETIIPLCKSILWQSEAAKVSAVITRKIRQAKTSLSYSQLLVDDSSYVQMFLDPIEQQALELRETIEKMKQATTC